MAKKPTTKNEAFNELVTQVVENNLQPAEDMEPLAAIVDEYIRTHKLAFVLQTANGQARDSYYIWYEPTKEWMALSWNKLRRDCPVVFKNNSEGFASHQRLVQERIKKANRVFRTARLRVVEFE